MKPEEYEALPILQWTPDPKHPGHSLFRSDRKFYYASDIPDDWIAETRARLESQEGGMLAAKFAHLARPSRERSRMKWIVCVIRFPDSHLNQYFSESELYFCLGLVDGALLAGLPKGLEP